MTSLRTTPQGVDRYEPTEIEPRWRKRWDEIGLYKTDLDDRSKPKYYVLTMYDYPSGDLHIGHWFVKTPTDVIARYHRMLGKNVFFPVGFDAFGLPAENAAIKSGVQPRAWTLKNIATMRRQLKTMGAMWDWDSEVITCEPEYYRWNQWLFLRFLEQRPGLSRHGTRRLVPQRRRPGARTGGRAGSTVLARWRAGRQEEPGAVVLPPDSLRRRAADLRRHLLARADQGPADQLDRTVGRGRGRVH